MISDDLIFLKKKEKSLEIKRHLDFKKLNEHDNIIRMIILTTRKIQWKTSEAIRRFLYLTGFLLFCSSSSSNDHASDNGVKHALIILPMMAMLMMRYRSLSSQILEAFFFLTSIFFVVCTTFTMMMMMRMMMMPDEFSITDGYSTMVWWHIHLKRDNRTLRDGVECHCMV